MAAPFKLSSRKQRQFVKEMATTTSTMERVLVAFLNRGFFGRMKWLLFGR